MPTCRPSLEKIGETLAIEMNEIIDRLGPDYPDLLAELSHYITQLPEHHPDWIPVMRGAHERLLIRRMGTAVTHPARTTKKLSPKGRSHHAPR